jgi:nucleoside-diphosphate-sugar epimerase
MIAGGRAIMAIVQASHVADGAVLAATNERAGGRAYNLANDFDVTWTAFYKLAGVGLERRIRTISISPSVARAGLTLAKRVLRLVVGGGMNVVSTASLDFMARDNPFSSARARRELGWNPRIPPDEAVPEAFRWWREQTGAR